MRPGTKGARIVALNQEGVDPHSIAAQVGTTIGTVKTVLARHRRMVRGVVTSPGAFSLLQAEAAERGMKPGQLASRVLELVFSEDLLEAILDE